MAEKSKKYTVADLFSEAAVMVREEFSAMKNKPLTAQEEAKIKALARTISGTVLKEMRLT